MTDEMKLRKRATYYGTDFAPKTMVVLYTMLRYRSKIERVCKRLKIHLLHSEP